MKKILFLFSFSFLLFSCGEEEAQFNMAEEELIKLLYDIQAAEAALQTVHSNVKDSVISIYYNQIYELHGIDQHILRQNIETLKKSPDKAHKIYKKVLEYHKKKDKPKK